MTNTTPDIRVIEAGSTESWGQFRLDIPGLPPIPKHFLKKTLGLTSMEVSLNALPPGGSMPFLHRHRENEELYIFLEGKGEFQAGDSVFPVQPGTCIRVATPVARAWRNTGDKPLTFLCVQAREGSYGDGDTVTDGEIVPGNLAWGEA